jgi:hypothetical protein
LFPPFPFYLPQTIAETLWKILVFLRFAAAGFAREPNKPSDSLEEVLRQMSGAYMEGKLVGFRRPSKI